MLNLSEVMEAGKRLCDVLDEAGIVADSTFVAAMTLYCVAWLRGTGGSRENAVEIIKSMWDSLDSTSKES